MAYIPETGSVVAFQSDPTNLKITASVAGTVDIGQIPGSVVAFQGTIPFIITGSVQTTITPADNQSVSGVVGASIIGLPYIAIAGSVAAVGTAVANQSVSGTVNVGNFPANQSISGTVLISNVPSPSIIAYQLAGSVMAISGSFTPAANQSVSGTVNIGNLPANQSVSGAVSVSNLPANQSVSGVVGVTQSGAWITSLVSTVPSSVQVGASIIGLTPVFNSGGYASVMLMSSTNASVATLVTNQLQGVSSVMLFGSTNTSIRTAQAFGYGSVMLMASTNSSVATLVQNQLMGVSSVMLFGSTNTSIVVGGATAGALGKADDAAHSAGDVGMLNLGVRNDTMASITTADVDYTPMTVGPVGEVIVANSPISKWWQATADLRVVQGASVQILGAQGASVFTYVTGLQVTNAGPNSVFVTFTGGLGSILGYTPAPIGGGSNIVYPNGLKTGANSGFSASINATSSVLISAQGFISKT